MAYQRLGLLDDARAALRRALDAERELSPTARSVRIQAEWALGEVLFAMGDHAGALGAFRSTEGMYPFDVGCGTSMAKHEYHYYLNLGLLHEYLGRYEKAVAAYLVAGRYGASRARARLSELYEAAGQRGDLSALLDAEDLRYADRRRRPTIRSILGGTCVRTALDRIIEESRKPSREHTRFPPDPSYLEVPFPEIPKGLILPKRCDCLAPSKSGYACR